MDAITLEKIITHFQQFGLETSKGGFPEDINHVYIGRINHHDFYEKKMPERMRKIEGRFTVMFKLIRIGDYVAIYIAEE